MPKKHDVVRLRHILNAAQKATQYSKGKMKEEVISDEVLFLALIRLVEIIGEAASKLSPEFKERNSQIAWRDIVNTRHRLIHGYEDIDTDVVWQIISNDLPPLIKQLEMILIEEERTMQENLFE